MRFIIMEAFGKNVCGHKLVIGVEATFLWKEVWGKAPLDAVSTADKYASSKILGNRSVSVSFSDFELSVLT